MRVGTEASVHGFRISLLFVLYIVEGRPWLKWWLCNGLRPQYTYSGASFVRNPSLYPTLCSGQRSKHALCRHRRIRCLEAERKCSNRILFTNTEISHQKSSDLAKVGQNDVGPHVQLFVMARCPPVPFVAETCASGRYSCLVRASLSMSMQPSLGGGC